MTVRRLPVLLPLLTVLATAAALVAVLPATAQRRLTAITVLYPEPRAAERIPLIQIENVRYVSTSDLARVFRATKYWRPEIQGYQHAYRAVTGVDLRGAGPPDATQPSVHLRNRLLAQGRGR